MKRKIKYVVVIFIININIMLNIATAANNSEQTKNNVMENNIMSNDINTEIIINDIENEGNTLAEIIEEDFKNANVSEVVKIDGIWRMVQNGIVNYEYTGIGSNDLGTWLVENGKVTFNYTGTYFEGDTGYIVEESEVYETVNKNTTEVMKINGTWRMVINGEVDYNYTGIGTNVNGTWLVENGKVTFNYTGTYTDETGTYLIEESKVKTDCIEVVKIDGIWRMVQNGIVNYNYTGIGSNDLGTWLVENGKVTFNYTGTYFEGNIAYIIEASKVYETVNKNTTEVMKINGTWRMVINGEVDYNYTGIGKNGLGTWLVENGKVTFNYTGTYLENKTGKTYLIEESKVKTACTEVVKIDGIWRMVQNGIVNYEYTGIGTNENGTWLVENGKVTFNYTGTYFEGDTGYIVEESEVYETVNKNTTEVMKINGIWRMVINGEVDYDYTGIGSNNLGTWLVENGEVTFNYTGIYIDETGTYFLEESKLRIDYTEVVKIDGIWRMVQNGIVNYNYTGIGTNENGIWLVENGKVTFNYTGTYFEGDTGYIVEESEVYETVNKNTTEVIKVNDIWRMVINGVVDYDYTGLGKNGFGTWYVENGKVTFNYNGIQKKDYTIYYFRNSQVYNSIVTDNNNPLTAIDKLKYYIQSNDMTCKSYHRPIYPIPERPEHLKIDYENLQKFFGIEDDEKVLSIEDEVFGVPQGCWGRFIWYDKEENAIKLCSYRRINIMIIIGFSLYSEVVIPCDNNAETTYEVNYRMVQQGKTNDATARIKYKDATKEKIELTNYKLLLNEIGELKPDLQFEEMANRDIKELLLLSEAVLTNKTDVSLKDFGFENYQL